MAISTFQPMLLLLASLFFLPPMHAVHFQYCREEGYVYGNITRVDISPYRVEGSDEPTITFSGFANNSSTNIYRGKIVVYIFSTTPWGTDAGRILVTKEFDAYDGVIEHGKNFELSIRVPSSEANLGETKVSITLIDELGLYEAKPGPQERICFEMFFTSECHQVPYSC
ncbi:hypothetical protein Bca52824_045279 [Brassica carinata]|uniref:MD-2-related lipid-recognition domain-containing protein n=1 Tax=Brassica carinata TaxID=52824 RepID=A0A8X7UMU5_BRACI|nr:hypothetical protein Bca52824_045279 [Brassica carinata]